MRYRYRAGSRRSTSTPDENNILYYGDNLKVMRDRMQDESVDLSYIDPPFNSKRNYNQIYGKVGSKDRAQAQAFVDTWTWDAQAMEGYQEIMGGGGGRFTAATIELLRGLYRVLGEGSLFAYLVSMTLRVAEIHRVLKPTGSFYLHCDPTASHYLKIILDSIFDVRNFRNEIIWKRSSAHSDTKQGDVKHMGRIHDVILFYTKSQQATRNELYQPYSDDYVNKMYRYVDEYGRRYRLDNLTGPGGAAKGNPQYEFLGVTRYWRYSKARMQELYEQGRVVQTKEGNVPAYKRYLDEMPGVPLQDVWDDVQPISSTAAERLGYPTQKPLTLMERIIRTSSNPGDVVFDPYAGCGTTVAAAQKLGRKWIGIDITYQSISLVLWRLENQFGSSVVNRIHLDGIPSDVESAAALAQRKDDRLRKEFEKWAILTYTNNRAIINEKKGADAGIDGVAYFHTTNVDIEMTIFQVKSGNADRADISTLRGDLERVGAKTAVLITLREPTDKMLATAKAAGTYTYQWTGAVYDRIQIVTVREIIEDKVRWPMPVSPAVLKAAHFIAGSEQPRLFDIRSLQPGGGKRRAKSAG